MATTDLIGALERTDHEGDTAPLPADVSRAVARYKAASAAIAIASDVMTARDLTDMESSDFEFVQDVMRESRNMLAAAGRLDLIGEA